MPLTPLPAPFLEALEGKDELVIGSREGARIRTVRGWFVTAPPGIVYLFADAYSRRAQRWRVDPWVRLTIPGSTISAEGEVFFVPAAELDADLSELVVERWGMWGAATPEGLKRMLRDGSHVLLRIDGS